MERLETQKRVKKVYMKFVDNGKLMPIDGDRKKSQVEQNILNVILDFLENHKTS
jgi:thymidylate kinase